MNGPTDQTNEPANAWTNGPNEWTNEWTKGPNASGRPCQRGDAAHLELFGQLSLGVADVCKF